MVTVFGYAPPAQAEFFESMGLLFPSGQGQARRFIHEAEDFAVFLPAFYKSLDNKSVWQICQALLFGFPSSCRAATLEVAPLGVTVSRVGGLLGFRYFFAKLFNYSSYLKR